jgi:hypothetical protein
MGVQLAVESDWLLPVSIGGMHAPFGIGRYRYQYDFTTDLEIQ